MTTSRDDLGALLAEAAVEYGKLLLRLTEAERLLKEAALQPDVCYDMGTEWVRAVVAYLNTAASADATRP